MVCWRGDVNRNVVSIFEALSSTRAGAEVALAGFPENLEMPILLPSFPRRREALLQQRSWSSRLLLCKIKVDSRLRGNDVVRGPFEVPADEVGHKSCG